MKETDESPLEAYFADEEDHATRKARYYHSTPRLDAFRARLADIPTSKLLQYASDFNARKALQHAVQSDVIFSACLCSEVLVPYVDSTKGWGSHVQNRPPCESYPKDYDTLYAGYVAVCDELDRRFPKGGPA
jgi:hypothetical protein